MDLQEVKQSVEGIENRLDDSPLVECLALERTGRITRVYLTGRLKRMCRKGRVWKSTKFLITMKNAAYGFDEHLARSISGMDGLFLLDRNHRPENEMMRKIFGRYLDKQGSGADEVAREMGVQVSDLLPVRLVSHHMRLLGVLHQGERQDNLVLVDYDDTK